MEDIIFILLAFAWLMYSLYQKQSKQKPEDKPESQAPDDEPQTEKKEEGFETIFRDVFGEEEVSAERKPRETFEQAETPQPQPEKQKPEGYDKHSGMSSVDDNFEFSAEGEIETIEDQVKKQKQQEEKVLEVIDLWDEEENENEVWDFDPRMAIIYSAIINRKY